MTLRLTRLLVLACLIGCFAVSMLAQDYKGLLGKWSMVSETDGGDVVNWTLVLKDANGQLTAFLSGEGGEQPTKSFSYTDGVLKFKVPYQGEDYDIELKATPEKLNGTWSGGGDSGKTSGTKSTS